MKRGEIVEGIVERVDYPGKGLVRIDESNAVWVKNVLPGQHVRVRVKKVRHGMGEASLVEVIERASNEIEPSCPHFGQCGGCTYQGLTYEDQLKLKEGQVKRVLDAAVDGEYEYQGIKASPVSERYRNKMEYTFGDEYKDGPLSLGMHKRGGFYDIVRVSECRIVHEDYGRILDATVEYMAARNIPYYHRMRHEGYLRHLLVRRAAYTGEIMVAIVTTTQMDMDMTGYKDMLLGLELEGTIVSVLHTFNDSLADVVKSDRTEILYGRDYITEKLLGMEFRISEFSFFQTNTKSAEVLYTAARDYIGDLGGSDKVVYDLYSGTGTIAQMMAPVSGKVIGVEIVEEAVEAAKENAKLNGLDNCEFIAGDVLEVLDNIVQKPDFIILDPPRDGVHPKALRKIIDYGVDRMIYISCKVTSLARDLEMLQYSGYRVEKAVAIDQFPTSSHVETVVLLNRQDISTSIEIELTAEDLELTRVESKATYKEIEMYVKNKFGLHVPNLYIAQVKQAHGIIERENYNKGSEGHRVPQCTREKWEAIEDALRYFKMI